jgi:TolB-like protein
VSRASLYLSRIGCLAISVLILNSSLHAQQTTLAVVDFEGFGVSATEAIALSNRLRNELFRLNAFKVVDRGLMEKILQEQNIQQLGCTSDECLVEVGRLLGVQQMIGGSISRVGSLFSVSARLVDVETGVVLNVSDYDIEGGIEDILRIGMQNVAVGISSNTVISSETMQAPPELTQVKDVSGEMKPEEELSSNPIVVQKQLPRLWQSRVGYLDGFHFEYFTLSYVYEIPKSLNLGGIQLKPTISGGFLRLWDTDWWDTHHEYGDWYRVETKPVNTDDMVYGLLEFHNKWSSKRERLGASLRGGLGVGWYSYETKIDSIGYRYYPYNEWDTFNDTTRFRDTSKGVSLVFSVGAQIQAKLPILPMVVTDIRLMTTPNLGSQVVLSAGVRGSFSQLAMLWIYISLIGLAISL